MKRLLTTTLATALIIVTAMSATTTPLFAAPPKPADNIHSAINRNDLAAVKKMVAANPACINLRNANQRKNTPLIQAIEQNHLPIIDFLLQKKASVNVKNSRGNTALHQVLRYHYSTTTKLVPKLLAHGADVYAVNNQKETILFTSCSTYNKNYSDVVALILKKMAKHANIDQPNISGWTPLHYACLRNSLPVVKLLLARDANPNIFANNWNDNHTTPLHSAVSNQNIELVNLLLAKRAETWVAGRNGMTPLHLAAATNAYNYRSREHRPSQAVQEKSGKIITALLSRGVQLERKTQTGETALQLAARHNNYVAVNILLARTSNLSAIKISNSESVAHWASRNGVSKAIELLIRHKQTATFTKKNHEGKTPLELACEGTTDRHTVIVVWLIASKVSVNTKNKDGETVAHSAAWNGNAKILQLLLQHNKTLATTKDSSGSSPIHLAAWNGHTEATSALLKAGCNIDVTNNGGSTALHIAAWKGHAKLTARLIQEKANLNAKDNDGLTPLHKAAWNGHLTIVTQLIAAGANPNAKDNDGYTALTKAKEQGKTGVVNYLQSLPK